MCCSWVGAVAAPPPRERQGGQFPRGLSPKLTPGETEAQGRSLQAAVLNPLPSPALSPAELGEEEESCCPHRGGPGPRMLAPVAPPAPSILQPLRLRPTPLPVTLCTVTVSAQAQSQGSPAAAPAPGGTRPAGTPPLGPTLLPGGRSHAPRPRAGSRRGAGGTLPACGAGVLGIHNSMGGIGPACQRGQEPGQPSPPLPPPGTHFAIFKSDWINLFGHRALSCSVLGGWGEDPGTEHLPPRAP